MVLPNKNYHFGNSPELTIKCVTLITLVNNLLELNFPVFLKRG